jgi:glutathione peroxidase-family protein
MPLDGILKILINKSWKVVKRFAAATKPEKLTKAIEYQ